MSDIKSCDNTMPEGPAPAYFPDPETTNIESGPPPPSYTQTQNETPPPTYESIYGEIRAAQREADGNRGTFLKRVCQILVNTIGFTVIIGVLLAIPILMIVVGALNLDNCPVERFIPIWLIVGGSSGALLQCISIFQRILKNCKKDDQEEDADDNGKACSSLSSVVGCFNIAWFFAGNVWVYRVNQPDTENPDDDDYCDHTTYYLAFWIITAVYICAILLCCCTCCIAAGATATGSNRN